MNAQTSILSFRDLELYQTAFRLQQSIFDLSKTLPREEAFSLTDQARRSSRSIGSNVAEAWAKRRYPAHFLAKLTDADGELQETFHWLTTAVECRYVPKERAAQLETGYATVGKMLGAMMAKHEKFCVR